MPECAIRFPGGRERALTFSYDDGCRFDPQLVELLAKRGLKATFNINSGLFGDEPGKSWRLTEAEVLALYQPAGMEIAAHGLHHTHHVQDPAAMAVYELLEDKRRLEQLTGKVVRGMAYAYGNQNDRIREVLHQCDFAYARGVCSSGGFGLPEDWLNIVPTCHHSDPRLMELLDRFLLEPARMQPARMFYVWGHSYEFDRNQNWKVMERFADAAGGMADRVWYATNGEICDYVQAYSQLHFSVAGDRVQNPTSTELWFLQDNSLQSVKPGETKELHV